MSDAPPPGWYPDPGGERQWRAWNGRDWSELTRSFDAPKGSLVAELPAIRATQSLRRYGVVAYFGGLGALIDLVHHESQLRPSVFQVCMTIGVVVTMFGHFAYARAVAHGPRGSLLLSELPILNVIVWADRVPREPGAQAPANVGSQLLLMVALLLYAAIPLPREAAFSALVHLLPAACAVVNLHWVAASQALLGTQHGPPRQRP